MYLKKHFISISTSVHDIYPWDSTRRIVKVRLFLEYQLYNFWARGGAVSAECSLGLGKMSLNLLEREIPATTSLNIVRAFHHPFSPCNGTRLSRWAEHPRAGPCFAASWYRGGKIPRNYNLGQNTCCRLGSCSPRHGVLPLVVGVCGIFLVAIRD